MKNRILLFLALIVSFLGAQAQYFYTTDDLSFDWLEGSLSYIGIQEYGDDIVPIQIYVSPMSIDMYHGHLHDEPPLATLSFQRNNRFLCLTFDRLKNYQGKIEHIVDINYITDEGENECYALNREFPAFANLTDQYWFNIDFENVFYDKVTDNIVIPCSYGYPFENYIIIGFGDNAGVNTLSVDEDSKTTTYYNLKGQSVNPGDNTNEIIIKQQGGKSEKVFSK